MNSISKNHVLAKIIRIYETGWYKVRITLCQIVYHHRYGTSTISFTVTMGGILMTANDPYNVVDNEPNLMIQLSHAH